jgi:CRISPR-associated protein Cmr3
LEFWQRPSGDELSLSNVKRLALATEVNLNGMAAHAGPAPLGGERRMMQWYESKTQLPPLPDGLVDSIAASGCCRLILLTPACFKAGWLPGWLFQMRDRITPKLKAAVVGKAQTVSGWRLEPPLGPKPARRMVPAGSVYFLQVGTDKAAIKDWVNHIWLQNVSDSEEDQLSGFGLAAIGVWDGQPKTIQEESHG